ncbi:MAG: MerR family transcriptional regulator [Pseudomonadota bacterium]
MSAPRSSKEPTAFRTISEASDEIGVAQHVLRHWEDVFSPVRPMRRAGGRRLYRLQDVELLRGIKRLLHDEGYTTKGVQKILKSEGSEFVMELGRGDSDAAAAALPGADASLSGVLDDIKVILKDAGKAKSLLSKTA